MNTAQVITIAISIAGLILTIITVYTAIRKNSRESAAERARIEADQAAFNARIETHIEELTREVRRHNNFAEAIPVIQEQIKAANHRIDDLEQGRS